MPSPIHFEATGRDDLDKIALWSCGHHLAPRTPIGACITPHFSLDDLLPPNLLSRRLLLLSDLGNSPPPLNSLAFNLFHPPFPSERVKLLERFFPMCPLDMQRKAVPIPDDGAAKWANWQMWIRSDLFLDFQRTLLGGRPFSFDSYRLASRCLMDFQLHDCALRIRPRIWTCQVNPPQVSDKAESAFQTALACRAENNRDFWVCAHMG